jgi:tripartite-type tricarboxylate transporter receptor subunit TctC
MNRRTTWALLGAAGAAALVPAGRADAQPGAPWPSRPIRLISPYPPGGSNDRVARMLAEPLTRALGQPVVVENRAGGGGALGAGVLANAPPDGYTFLYAAPAQLTTTPVLVRDLPYDAERDFAPVSLTTTTAYAFAVRADSPIRSMAELIAQARRGPARSPTRPPASPAAGTSPPSSCG